MQLQERFQNLPQAIFQIFDILRGYEIYLIGGCVRDLLLGNIPKDYDFTTSATPQEMLQVFTSYGIKTLDVGIRFGTIGVVLEKQVFEITTFRKEGGYKDFRRPNFILFSKTLKEDVLRRDFSINALAWHPDFGIIDHVGGRFDLKNKILRTIGVPDERFGEDSLRILRGVGFCARFGLEVEEKTKESMLKNAPLLHHISKERIQNEWEKILGAREPIFALKEFVQIFEIYFGEEMDFDVKLPQNPLHRAAILLEDGKKLEKLSYSKKDKSQILQFMQWQKKELFTDKIAIKKMLANYQIEWIKVFLESDLQKSYYFNEIFKNNEVFSLGQLEIDGKDVLVFPNHKRKEILQKILFLVIEGRLKNIRKDLLCYLQENKEELQEN
ncbi:CCA tRNA nucleotidyltransferase [Helicobacter anatolicus]|uniref:CCA tRNA nucleotidyltransferase n=1 Tax=Helicobacter anatolicus TaxID=2905874 RepID=UPI001E2A2D86|nr:hypothetical protein [Helicobacter anatolicus]MCE3038153.1 hypothetical protein [Helicobacter anatolicus]